MAQVKPQVIDDEQHERVYERVAAVDVAKDTGMVCTRTPHPSRPGARAAARTATTRRQQPPPTTTRTMAIFTPPRPSPG